MTKQKHFYLFRGLIREKGHWNHFITHLAQTFPEAKISTIDIPGAGEYFQSSSPLSIKGMVEQMRPDYLKLKSEHDDCHLIAISLGGMIALEWLKLFPQDFNAATLINTSYGGVSPLFERLKPSALGFLLKVPLLKGRQKEARIINLISNKKDVFEETLNLWEKIATERPVSLENTLRQLMAAAFFNVGDFKPNIPIHILGSTSDRMVSVKCSQAIAKKWNLPISEHPTAGHDLTTDEPEWTAKQIKEAISKFS